MMEAASTSVMLVNFCQTAERNNPEDSHLINVCVAQGMGQWRTLENTVISIRNKVTKGKQLLV
jgi:hypothetical protein